MDWNSKNGDYEKRDCVIEGGGDRKSGNYGTSVVATPSQVDA